VRIGIDFDNTIVDYEGVFHAAAVERRLIGQDFPHHKNTIRDFLNRSGREDEFTLLQGYVYGARMDLARPYGGVLKFVADARRAGHELYIVSHKTGRPILGPNYDLHGSARAFLREHGLAADHAIPEICIYFEETKEEKVARVAALDLDVFIDDLPEILVMPGLPARCRRILFAPDGAYAAKGFDVCRSWGDVAAVLLGSGA
jgi:hypothetical protein